CSFCCSVPLSAKTFPFTKMRVALGFPGPCHPFGTPTKALVAAPWGAPGQPPADGEDSHPLLATVVWLFVRSTVTVVVVAPCPKLYTAVRPCTLIVRPFRLPWT